MKKKRILSLLLAVLMTCSVLIFSSCGEEEEVNDNYIYPKTVTLYSIRGEGTTDEAIALVEKALNAISKPKYKTAVKLVLYTEEEYDAKIAQKMAEAKAANQASLATKKPGISMTEKGVTDATTIIDGFTEVIYPSAGDAQLDIFLVRDRATYQSLVENKQIQDLTKALSYGVNTYDECTAINRYVNATMMSAMQVGGKTYGVPQNHILGSFTYMLLDKSLMDAGSFSADDMKSLYDLSDYLEYAATQNPDHIILNCADPMYEIIAPDTHLGTLVTNSPLLSDKVPQILLGDKDYADFISAKHAYEQLGYLSQGSFTDTTSCAVTFVSGLPASVADQYGEDYYVVPYGMPSATEADLFSSVYVVSSEAADLERCMQILNLMTVNKDFRNTLQYGITEEDALLYNAEGKENYEIDETTGYVHKLNNTYNMNPLYTGNLFLLIPCDSMSATELAYAESHTYAEIKQMLGDTCTDDEWVGEREYALAKSINNAVLFSPYYGFTPNARTMDQINASFDTIQRLSGVVVSGAFSQTYEQYLAANAGASVGDYIDHMSAQLQAGGATLANNPTFQNTIFPNNATGWAGQFYTWYKGLHPESVPAA